ncbi:MAG: diguanylate cyclase/phosphodiesterase with sensor [Herbinix sp.]|jgi:diguanylate cyclase (GGDEF)-like protein|nr:diguanylate cyclase/phosphodiesterase with sensor [Herbinix sp.]
MDENNKLQLEQLLQSAPGGIAKLAFDDMLTILYATDTFYSLIKNVTDKVNTKDPLALLRIVYSADIIYVTQQLATQKHRKDNRLNLNFRTLQQDGSFKWVMITGDRTAEVYQSGTKSVSVYSCIAMDVTDLMLKYKKLEQASSYQRVIAELSKDLYFEYEIATDTLSFSELFHEIFGKEAVMPGFRKRLEKTKIIHPEEQPAVVGIFNSMMSGRKQARFELRLIPKDGKPCWYICYASIIFGENKNPYKVVGKLSATNPLMMEPETEVHKPQFDALTNVCTKESVEIMVSEAAAKQGQDTLSAFLLIDIRNYKNINEIKRTINGENILTTIGRLMKAQFRTSDIIGRVGLSEFVIYVRDIYSDEVAFHKAEEICKAIEALYSYEHTKSGITVSIGIALQKGVQEYQSLLANANTALVMAKKVPTSSFEVFVGQ